MPAKRCTACLASRPHHALIAVHQRLHQPGSSSLPRQRIHAATTRAATFALLLLLHLAHNLVELVVGLDEACTRGRAG